MKNKKYTIEELRSIIFEGINTMSELDVVDTNQFGEDGEGSDASIISSNLNPHQRELVKKNIAMALQSGRSALNNEWGAKDSNRAVFISYITNLAQLYQSKKLTPEEAMAKIQATGNEKYVQYYQLYLQGLPDSEIAQRMGILIGDREDYVKINSTNNKRGDASVIKKQFADPVQRLVQSPDQEKIKTAILDAMAPVRDGRPTIFYKAVRNIAGSEGDTNDSFYEIFMTSFFRAVDYSLSNFDITKSNNFYSYLMNSVANVIKAERNTSKGGFKDTYKTTSLDDKIGDDDTSFSDYVVDSGDNQSDPTNISRHADALQDKYAQKINKGDTLYGAVVSYISNKLAGKGSESSKMDLQIFNSLFVDGNSTEETAQQLGITPQRIREKIYLINGYIAKLVGDFQKYLNSKGYNVKLPNNTFKINVSGASNSSDKTENPYKDLPDIERGDGKKAKKFDVDDYYYNHLEEFVNMNEVKLLLANIIAESIKVKMEKIDFVYNTLNNQSKILNESTQKVGEGYEVDAKNLYETVKEFVDSVIYLIQGDSSVPYGDEDSLISKLHRIYGISNEIKGEYKSIADDIEKTVQPLINIIYEYPAKLRDLVRRVKTNYNPTRAYGI